jgi:WD40 repeat protein
MGSVSWSPDGRWFASANWARDITIRDAETWQIHWEIDQDDIPVVAGAQGDYAIAWSPTSSGLAAVNGAGQLVMWSLQDAKKAQKVWTVQAHTSNIRTLAWSLDGSRIASGSEDRTAKIWEAKTGQELLTLDGHSQMVWSVRWSPDSRRLATTENDALRIWDATEAYEKLGNRPP